MVQDDVQARWWKLEEKLLQRFQKKPDLNAVLMLIGVQETHKVGEKLTKEQKQDIMHVGICTVLTPGGYYVQTHVDEEGWPHFNQLKALPDMNMIEQELFIKDFVLLYFQQQELI
jgi:hypothetical protein